MKRRRTPQEKKLLRYARDGRNTVAESRGIVHRAIARRKAKASRALRRAASQQACAAAGDGDDAEVFVARTGRRSWRKTPDAPLAVYVAARLAVREQTGMNAADEPAPLRKAARARARFRDFGLKGSLQLRPPKPRAPDEP